MTTALLLAVILIVAVVLWIVPGIDATLRKLLIAVCVVCFILWLLFVLGVFSRFDGGTVIIRD